MARHTLNRRSVIYTENDVYRAVPVARVPVAPGTAVRSLEVSAQVQFTQLTALQQAPVVLTLDVFYVPLRLVWAGFVDFFSDADSTATVPVAAVNSVDFFDPVANRSALFRRAYKLAYNEFYGSEALSNGGSRQCWYPNIDADGTTTLYRVQNPEQLSGVITDPADLTDPTYPVAAPIPLRDFSAAQARALGSLRRERSGDKYVDALARIGVSLDWRIQGAPELVARASKLLQPGQVYATDTSGLGKPSRVLDGTIVATASGKFFAEEGYLVGILSARPIMVMKDGSGTLDGFQIKRADFLYGSAEDLVGPARWAGGILAGGTDAGQTPALPAYHYGDYVKGYYSSPGAFTSQLDSNSIFDRVYPDPNAWPASNVLSGKHFGVLARTSLMGQTPVARDFGLGYARAS